MRVKSIFKSKVLWVNFITIVAVLATHYGITPNQEVADQVTKTLIYLSPVLNAALRFVTKDAVKVY